MNAVHLRRGTGYQASLMLDAWSLEKAVASAKQAAASFKKQDSDAARFWRQVAAILDAKLPPKPLPEQKYGQCKAHRDYLAMRAPVCFCEECWRIWIRKQDSERGGTADAVGSNPTEHNAHESSNLSAPTSVAR